MVTTKHCASCGFLARRPLSTLQAATFFEMPERTRANGGGWWTLQVAGLGTRTVPTCCIGAYPILDEIKEIEPTTLTWASDNTPNFRSDSTTPERTKAAKTVFNKPRPECSGWFPHTPGLSPEKHLELRNMQRLEMESARRDADSARRDRRSFWAFLIIAFVGLVLAGVQIWAQLQGINVTVNYPPTPNPPSAPDTEGSQP